jgi:hypothetical protein
MRGLVVWHNKEVFAYLVKFAKIPIKGIETANCCFDGRYSVVLWMYART